MATVLVTGGTGTLGSYLVKELQTRGHEVRATSRRPGVGTHRADLTTGEGVETAVRGAQWIVHAASDTRRLGRRDLEQTRHLLEAAAEGVEHLLYISIVGVDSIPYRYYQQKCRCEELVSASSAPFTILRATQFHELLSMMLQAVQRLPIAPLPTKFRFQPVAAREVANRMADLIEGPPVGRAADFGGPEALDLGQFTDQWKRRYGRPRRVLTVPVPGRIGRALRAGLNTCPDHAEGKQTWEEFLADLPR